MEFTGVFPSGANLNDYICKSAKINSITKNDFNVIYIPHTEKENK